MISNDIHHIPYIKYIPHIPVGFLFFYVVNPPIPQYHQTWDVANYSKMGVRSRFIVYKYKPNNHSSKPLITYNL